MNDEELLSYLRRHFSAAGARNYNVLDFTFRYGSVLEALMFSHLFWPDFVEFEGMVFFKEIREGAGFSERVKGALNKFAGNRSAVERSFNLREVTTQLLGKDLKETTDEQIDWLEQRLVEMWTARLSNAYPEKRFAVEIVVLDPHDPESDTGITFYHVGNG